MRATKVSQDTFVYIVPIPTRYINTLQKSRAAQAAISFEEVKLILGLAWQRGRWDGSDGGVFARAGDDGRRAQVRGRGRGDIRNKFHREDVSGRFETISRTGLRRNRRG